MEILPGLHLVDKKYSNTYLLVMDKKIYLVDSGIDKNAKNIISYIKKIGYKLSDISYVLVTHSHIDHVCGLSKIKELSNSKIAVHSLESKIISGEEPMISPKGIVESIKLKIISTFLKYKPIRPDILLKDNDKIEKIEVIHVPGHTRGSVCFYVPEKKLLFSGDLIFFKKNKFVYPNPSYTYNENELKKSLIRISKLNFDYLLPGHNDIVGPNASDLLRKFLEE